MAKIKNWSDFQHFKDRRPPWIKLHRDILENRDISSISDCSFRVLVGIWLLASEDKEMEGSIPDVEDIAFRLRMEKSKVIKALKELNNFLIQDDISAISDGYQLDVPEVETEKRRDKGEVEVIFEFWKTTFNHPRSVMDPKRKKLITAALKIYSVDDLKEAIIGCSKTPHNIGKNDNNQVYDGLHIILKDSDNIERFMNNAGNKNPAGQPPMRPLENG